MHLAAGGAEGDRPLAAGRQRAAHRDVAVLLLEDLAHLNAVVAEALVGAALALREGDGRPRDEARLLEEDAAPLRARALQRHGVHEGRYPLDVLRGRRLETVRAVVEEQHGVRVVGAHVAAEVVVALDLHLHAVRDLEAERREVAHGLAANEAALRTRAVHDGLAADGRAVLQRERGPFRVVRERRAAVDVVHRGGLRLQATGKHLDAVVLAHGAQRLLELDAVDAPVRLLQPHAVVERHVVRAAEEDVGGRPLVAEALVQAEAERLLERGCGEVGRRGGGEPEGVRRESVSACSARRKRSRRSRRSRRRTTYPTRKARRRSCSATSCPRSCPPAQP